ncbi:putative mitochondrial protein [Apostasia shenzhenica]|uniref:Putative mitochondrial protein n=1 Tax=Apostasia shenzhenica TaxID=1088818 RepID=A0A2I0AMF7_9ASPA|nr:putative mitochondrial protein [Apostasia shenzhenica]
MPQTLKDTWVVLVPKISNAEQPKQFRPISLCTTVYKVIAKVLVHKLKEHISSLVSLEKRSLWIRASRGLRQGCPLSPYLFILSSELLSTMVHREMHKGMLSGIKVTSRAQPHSHLIFADDLLFFAKATLGDADSVKQILDNYCGYSGQMVNADKSSIFSFTTTKNLKLIIRRRLWMQEGQQWRYLGIPLTKHRPKKVDFSTIVIAVRNRISAWGVKSLSLAGRIMLINSTLTSMPVFI